MLPVIRRPASIVLTAFMVATPSWGIDSLFLREILSHWESAAQRHADTVIQARTKAPPPNVISRSGKCPASLSRPRERPLGRRPVVFLSSTMPRASLKELVTEAKQIPARLVIRGMIQGSMTETTRWVKELGHPVDIDPKLFQKYGVTEVPTFLIPIEPEKIYRIKGNVTLSYALEKARQIRSAQTGKSKS